jgi:hypothetical protein
VFLRNETKIDYEWANGKLDIHVHSSIQTSWPAIIVTDNQATLKDAIHAKYPQQTTTTMLCRWYINKDVLANCPGAFATIEK